MRWCGFAVTVAYPRRSAKSLSGPMRSSNDGASDWAGAWSLLPLLPPLPLLPLPRCVFGAGFGLSGLFSG